MPNEEMSRRDSDRTYKRVFVSNAITLLIMAFGWVYVLGQQSTIISQNTKNIDKIMSVLEEKMDEGEVKEFVSLSIAPISQSQARIETTLNHMAGDMKEMYRVNAVLVRQIKDQ